MGQLDSGLCFSYVCRGTECHHLNFLNVLEAVVLINEFLLLIVTSQKL